jgi:hypothetical protein
MEKQKTAQTQGRPSSEFGELLKSALTKKSGR